MNDPSLPQSRIWSIFSSKLFTTTALAFLIGVPLSITAWAHCGDARDRIIQEYINFRVSLRPTCASFTRTKRSANFSFAELNGSDYPFAILTDRLLNGLENVRRRNGNRPLGLTSGYRNPARNRRVGGASQSRHMYGDAADIGSNATTFDPLRRAGKGSGACCEPKSLSGTGHVHVDYRGACPPGW